LAELGGFFHADASGFQGTSRTTAPAFQWHITPTHYFESPPFASRHPCISFAITPLRPLSRGRLLPIADRGSWNPAGALPIAIDPAYLQVPSDVQDFLEAIAWTRNMIAESGWDALLAEEVFPRPRRTDWTLAESSLRRFASTIYHYAGTCGLGIDSDSCLDPHFRVRGIDRLWVCDASVMPQLVSCNPQVTVMMMAMRLADWLGQ
jgi:choline dehydrogenase-like flavoprotein